MYLNISREILTHIINKVKELFVSKELLNERVKKDVPVDAKFTDTEYNHPKSHPYSMITGVPKSLPASGGQSNSSKHLIGDDTRDENSPPSEYMSGGSRYENRAGWQTEFKSLKIIGNPPNLIGNYAYLQTLTPWSDPSGGYPIQIIYGNGHPCWRVGVNVNEWSSWISLNENIEINNELSKKVNIDYMKNELKKLDESSNKYRYRIIQSESLN